MTLSVHEAEKFLEGYLSLHHSLTLDDVEITDTKGYWVMKKECDETCHHPIHACLGCNGRTRHTIRYVQYGRNDKGQFKSPYEVWIVLHDNKVNL